MDPITIGLAALGLFAAKKAVTTRQEMKRDERENQDLRDRADAIIAAMDRRNGGR